MATTAARFTYDAALMAEDLAGRGWTPKDLSKRARVADVTVYRFLSGEFQTPKTAKKLARALGYSSPRRYLVSVRKSVAA
jgi:ribosome-binding protein aMBF1 (putative translation factor)